MTHCDRDDTTLVHEHGVLLRQYGAIQQRYSAQTQCLCREIEQLQAQLMRSYARAIVRISALAWAREDRQPTSHLPATRRSTAPRATAGAALPPAVTSLSPLEATFAQSDDDQWLEHSLRCADLVICQTGCLSHGAFWRVQDHCKRTGKTCVLVDQPGALTIVRLRPNGQNEPANPPSLAYAKDTP